jgi:hypothetical protein
LVVVGFLIAAAGTAAALGEILHDYRGTSRQEVLYQVAAAVSYGLIAWAWWSILGSLRKSPGFIGKKSSHALMVFAVASVVVAVSWLGEIDQVESFELHWRLRTFEPPFFTFGWTVLAVGLCIAALGFWRASRTGDELEVDAASGSQDRTSMRHDVAVGPPLMVLAGYGLVALGLLAEEWFGRAPFHPDLRGELTNDIGTVIGYGLFGIAWFLLMSEMSVTVDNEIRHAYGALAVASGLLALGFVAIGWVDLEFHQHRSFVSLLVSAAGFGIAAVGFWRASAPALGLASTDIGVSGSSTPQHLEV